LTKYEAVYCVEPLAVKAGGARNVLLPPVGFTNVAVFRPLGSSVAPELLVTVPLVGDQLESADEYGQ
jgi:hypothetical protein